MARTFGNASKRRRTFQYRARGQQTHQIAGNRPDGYPVPYPVDVAGDVAPHAAASHDLVGPARKELLDHGAPPRQQAVRVFALRHALARNVRHGKRVAFQHRDLPIKSANARAVNRPPMLAPTTTACSPIRFMMHPA